LNFHLIFLSLLFGGDFGHYSFFRIQTFNSLFVLPRLKASLPHPRSRPPCSRSSRQKQAVSAHSVVSFFLVRGLFNPRPFVASTQTTTSVCQRPPGFLSLSKLGNYHPRMYLSENSLFYLRIRTNAPSGGAPAAGDVLKEIPLMTQLFSFFSELYLSRISQPNGPYSPSPKAHSVTSTKDRHYF